MPHGAPGDGFDETFLSGGGEAGAILRTRDWSDSPLAAPASWPQSLRSVVGLLLSSKFPMFVAWGPQLGFLYNDAYAEILGTKHPAAMGRRFRDIWPEIWSDIAPLVDAALAGQAIYRENLPLLMNRRGYDEQTWFTFSYSPARDEAGRVAGVFCACTETTANILAGRNAAHYRALFEAIDEGFCIIEFIDGPHGPMSDYVHVEANPAYTAHAGIPDIVGKKVREMVPDEAAAWVEIYRRVLLTGEPVRFERELVATGRHLELAAFRVEPAERRQVAVLFKDVTGRKRAEAQLRDLNETLEQRVARAIAEREQVEAALRQSQKMEAMGQLTGGVAHDFNNLLTPIVASLDMLQRKGLGGEREQRLIAGAVQAAERAKVLVQRLLAFARRQPLQPVPVDVGRLVVGMSDLVASTTGPQIKVVVDVQDALPSAHADANQLEMALLNLAVNARDAMPDGGTLRISARAERLAAQRAPLAPGAYVRLSVADTGIGMDATTVKRAVEPFFSTKGVGKGTGLGLSMVDGLASQLGGALFIASNPGLGTNVELWLPQTASAPEARDPTPAAVPSTEMRGTALVVDDDQYVRLSTADMLIDLGFAVVEAVGAEEALRALDTHARIDLVVTDHLMPGMSGTDLAREIRATRPGLPVLLISGYAELEGIEPGLPRLAKPFRKDELAASLAAMGANA